MAQAKRRACAARADLAEVVVLPLHAQQLIPADSEGHRLVLSLADAKRGEADVRRAAHVHRRCRCPRLGRGLASRT